MTLISVTNEWRDNCQSDSEVNQTLISNPGGQIVGFEIKVCTSIIVIAGLASCGPSSELILDRTRLLSQSINQSIYIVP